MFSVNIQNTTTHKWLKSSFVNELSMIGPTLWSWSILISIHKKDCSYYICFVAFESRLAEISILWLCLAANLPSACSSYTTISDSTRSITYSGSSGCDQSTFSSSGTWVRFTGSGGTQIPTSAPAYYRCGTSAPGWYNGAMPSAGNTVTGTVCYYWSGNTCNWSNSVQVANCNSYYVYYVVRPPVCSLRYCTV